MKIQIESTVNNTIDKVWDCWTNPEHIVNWNFASDDWHCPNATNDLKVGGKFSSTMAAKDGSFSFEFAGIYDEIIHHQYIKYTMEDGRQVETTFKVENNSVLITSIFDAEEINSADIQKSGWQAILNNFKKYTESK
jgi:uncharacterized protein YndB with AHSA1/START domain